MFTIHSSTPERLRALHASFIFSSSTTIFPSLSFTHPPPTTSLLFLTICLATLNTCPFSSSSSNKSPNFFLSASCALNITLFALPLACLYASWSSTVLDLLHILYNLRFSSIALPTSSFHHHVSLCLGKPLVFP